MGFFTASKLLKAKKANYRWKTKELGDKKMNNEQITTLLQQVLVKLEETDQRLAEIKAHEAAHVKSTEKYLCAIQEVIQNNNVM